MMYHTWLEQFWFMVMWKIHVFYWHTYVDKGTSAPAVSLYKLNSAVQWSLLINLDCWVALFSKMRWLYPSWLRTWYTEVKGICSYFSSHFFSSHSIYFHLFSWKSCYPPSFSLLKNVKGFGSRETKYLFTSAYEKKAAALQSSVSSISRSTEWQGGFKI